EQAGCIRNVGAAGVFSLLPLGFEAHQKICTIVYKEMARAGVLNLQLPILQPRELWEQTNRWARYHDTMTMFETVERHSGQMFGLAPTAEEVVTALAASEVRSWRDLPLHLHQIGPKFRDEIRPRLGLLRCREFSMSDAYSFDADEAGMRESFEMYRGIYRRIFERVGLTNCIAVQADSGAIGGQGSAEFMAVCESGEDLLLTCDACDYGANAQKANSRIAGEVYSTVLKSMHREPTPDIMTVEQLEAYFPGLTARQMVKTIIFTVNPDSDAPHEIAVCIRGDLEVNETKLVNALGADAVVAADAAVVREVTGAAVGFAGPIGLTKVRQILFDRSVEVMTNFLCGVNTTDVHALDANLGRDFPAPNGFHDLHLAKGGDHCANCATGTLRESRGIEVGHIFMLQTGYAEKLSAAFLDQKSASQVIWMGCYGIGTTRLMQAVVEQNRDENGIIWPESVAPFDVYILPINSTNPDQMALARAVSASLVDAGYNVLFDDRGLPAGPKFMDADLIGCPWRVNVGRRAAEQTVELINRRTKETLEVHLTDVISRLAEQRAPRP
ncbi:MAG: proline--tRNA ligase, partial [Candidatus Edwardsbacteria bacterium]|nr:proline--tRNA ligase [Candidatus Edwardsbacteria bacterium]